MLNNVLIFFSGIGLFLYGVTTVSSGALTYGENILNSRINKLLSSGISATLTGLTVTAVIQSSSATNSIAVKLSDSYLLNQKTSFYIIMGANIGTTVTAYLSIISTFDISYYISASMFFAILTAVLTKNIKVKNTAMMLCSLSLIFIGLNLVNSSMSAFEDIIYSFLATRTNRFLLLILAMLLTAVLQSSSLTSVLLVAMAAANIIDITAAVYMVMGINIGSCGSVLLACAGCKKQGVVCALFHLFFNIVGTIINIFFIETGVLNFFVNAPLRADIKIALYHTFFNTVTTLLIYYFVPEVCSFLNNRLKNNSYFSASSNISRTSEGAADLPTLRDT